jgi:rubrerythrin
MSPEEPTSADQSPSAEVVARLLQAWRGEIEARAIYLLIAAREKDAQRAEIIVRLADAEAGHRELIEQRLRELRIEVPDPKTVRISLWTRLQAKIAPIDRLLLARETAENEEVNVLYERSTGDAKTDNLLREIRKDERSHSQVVQGMRSGSSPSDLAKISAHAGRSEERRVGKEC